MGKNRKIDIEYCKKIAENKKGLCLSIQYSTVKDKMTWKCEKNHTWDTKLENILYYNCWCPICAKERKKENNIKKFGVEYPLQNKEILAKTKQTLESRHNVTNPMHSQDFKDKIIKTNLERYNCSFPLQSKTVCEKIKKTNVEKYGHEYVLSDPKIYSKSKQTMLEKYGTEHALQNEELFRKASKNVNKIMVKKHWKTQEELMCRGSYEAKTVDYLNNYKVEYVWQPSGFLLENGTKYFPDILIEGTYVEIKGYFWPKSRVKWDLFKALFPNSELWDKALLLNKGIL